MTPSERAAAYIDRCTAVVAAVQQKDGKWNLTLPEPVDEVEREALQLFIAELQDAIGMPPPSGGTQ